MNRLLTPAQMSEAEEISVKLGVSLWELMSHAGQRLAEIADEKAKRLGAKNILLLCGAGNNGGDGFVCADYLAKCGYTVTAALMCGEPKTELARMAYSLINTEKINITAAAEKLSSINPDIIIDCIFGTGFHGEFRDNGHILKTLKAISETDAYIIACDMPSGVDALRGTAANGTLCCDMTVTFHAEKIGMAISPAKEYCGDIHVADIGIPDGWQDMLTDRLYAEEANRDYLHTLMPERSEYSHKGTFGKLLLICGCESYVGAAGISSRAALHTGCGITNLASVRFVVGCIAGTAPECVYTMLSADDRGYINEREIPRLVELANKHDAVVLGCGIGQSDGTQKLVEEMIKNVEKLLLIDADGINQLAKNIDVLRDKKCEIVLTPHIGELARLCGKDISSVKSDRLNICRSLAEKYGIILHSKDVTSMTVTANSAVLTSFGCSALAKGGSGDMLAGIIGSLMAQGTPPDKACLLGGYIMGRTSEILCERCSPAAVTASDIIGEFKTSLTKL